MPPSLQEVTGQPCCVFAHVPSSPGLVHVSWHSHSGGGGDGDAGGEDGSSGDEGGEGVSLLKSKAVDVPTSEAEHAPSPATMRNSTPRRQVAVCCALSAARSALRWARLGDTRRVGFSACAAEMAPFGEGAAFPCQCGLETSRMCTVPCLSTEKRRQLGITLTFDPPIPENARRLVLSCTNELWQCAHSGSIPRHAQIREAHAAHP